MVLAKILGALSGIGLFKSRRGQTALEYLLMIAVVLTLLVVVIALTQSLGMIGGNVGAVIGNIKSQVLGWLFT